MLGRCPAIRGNTCRLRLCTAVSVEHPRNIVNGTKDPGRDVGTRKGSVIIHSYGLRSMSSGDGRSRLNFNSVRSALIKHSAQSSQIRPSKSLSLQHKRAISVQIEQKSAYSETRRSRAMAADVVAVVSIPDYFLGLLGYYSLHSRKKTSPRFRPLALEEIVNHFILSWTVKNSVGMTRVRFQLHGRILRAFTTHRNGTKGPARVSPQIEPPRHVAFGTFVGI